MNLDTTYLIEKNYYLGFEARYSSLRESIAFMCTCLGNCLVDVHERSQRPSGGRYTVVQHQVALSIKGVLDGSKARNYASIHGGECAPVSDKLLYAKVESLVHAGGRRFGERKSCVRTYLFTAILLRIAGKDIMNFFSEREQSGNDSSFE